MSRVICVSSLRRTRDHVRNCKDSLSLSYLCYLMQESLNYDCPYVHIRPYHSLPCHLNSNIWIHNTVVFRWGCDKTRGAKNGHGGSEYMALILDCLRNWIKDSIRKHLLWWLKSPIWNQRHLGGNSLTQLKIWQKLVNMSAYDMGIGYIGRIHGIWFNLLCVVQRLFGEPNAICTLKEIKDLSLGI